MAYKNIIPVRVEGEIHTRILKLTEQRGCTFSDATRTVLKSGLDVVERNHDLIDGQKLIEFLHDILRYVIKIDSVIFEGIIKETIQDPDKISEIYKSILNDLESRGFRKPLIKNQ